MRQVLNRRLTRLEQNASPALPWHLPLNQWSDSQLLFVAAPGRTDITDEELAKIAKGGAP
jgi:hypothetical protein